MKIDFATLCTIQSDDIGQTMDFYQTENGMASHLWLTSLVPYTEACKVAYYIFSSDFDIAYTMSEQVGFLSTGEIRRIDIVWARHNRNGTPVTDD